MKSILQTILANWKEILSVLAVLLSAASFWYTFFLKGTPIFACAKWTAVQMIANGQPKAAFALQVSIYNKGRVPLQVYDFVLRAKSDDGQQVLCEAIVLWDLRQWIEDGDRLDKVGRAQKGQVPLPLIISPGQLYDFNYPILFLPIDKTNLIDPRSANKVTLTLYARTDRADDYEFIASQEFPSAEIKEVLVKTFVSILSTESISKREELLQKIR